MIVIALYTDPARHNTQRSADGRTDGQRYDIMMPIADNTV